MGRQQHYLPGMHHQHVGFRPRGRRMMSARARFSVQYSRQDIPCVQQIGKPNGNVLERVQNFLAGNDFLLLMPNNHFYYHELYS